MYIINAKLSYHEIRCDDHRVPCPHETSDVVPSPAK